MGGEGEAAALPRREWGKPVHGHILRWSKQTQLLESASCDVRPPSNGENPFHWIRKILLGLIKKRLAGSVLLSGRQEWLPPRSRAESFFVHCEDRIGRTPSEAAFPWRQIGPKGTCRLQTSLWPARI